MSTTTSVTRYRSRPTEVDAIRFLGPDTCEEVFAFIGWEHSDDELEHSQLHGLGLDGEQEAGIGDWIVRDEDGVYDVYADTAFHAEFEQPDPMKNTFTWGQSVGMTGGVVDIPLNNNADDVVVLMDMLDGILAEMQKPVASHG
jgi:hypothetical protein